MNHTKKFLEEKFKEKVKYNEEENTVSCTEEILPSLLNFLKVIIQLNLFN